MTFSVVINNYNYGRYLRQAIDGCLALDRRLLKEIVIVDDGSTDDSREILESYSDSHCSLVVTIFQENSGQMSAMRAGIRASTGDVVCFLDSDDFIHRSDYLNILEDAYRRKNPDSVFIGQRIVRSDTGESLAKRRAKRSRFVKRSRYLASHGDVFIGLNTSTMSMQSVLAKRIAEYPSYFDGDWRRNADTVFVFAVSILGGSKYFLREKAVTYRIHGSNSFFGKGIPDDATERRRDIKRRMCGYWSLQSGKKTSLSGFLMEACSPANIRSCEKYCRILWKYDDFGPGKRILGSAMLLVPAAAVRILRFLRRRQVN